MSKKGEKSVVSVEELEKQFLQTMDVPGYNKYQIFSDFCACTACAIHSPLERKTRQEREDHYKMIVSRYREEDRIIERFGNMLGMLVLMTEQRRYTDILGDIYMNIEMGNKNIGQFFTPQHLSDLSAAMIFEEETAREEIREKGFVTVHEPCSGGGSMILAVGRMMKEYGLNPDQELLMIANDLDPMCVHMSYIQLSLNAIPAIVTRGDALKNEVTDAFITPGYFLSPKMWRYEKLLKRGESEKNFTLENKAERSSGQKMKTEADQADRIPEQLTMEL